MAAISFLFNALNVPENIPGAAPRNVMMNFHPEIQKQKKWHLETAGNTERVWL